MSRNTAFYCRCGARLVGAERVEHRCAEPPLPDATGTDPDAENDPTLRDLETVCAWCGMEHSVDGFRRDCPCSRHIDGGAGLGVRACNAAKASA